jgi:predicted DNA binding CopG/RHH family protein
MRWGKRSMAGICTSHSHCDKVKRVFESFPHAICIERKGLSMAAKTKVPKFRTEAQERRFWEARDSTELFDWSKAKRVRFPNLKPSTQSISLRLPLHTLERLKAAANVRDVPYQSLIKVWLEEKLSA